MRVGVVQLSVGYDKPQNLARLRELVVRAAADGAELVVCPEGAMHEFGRSDTPLAPVAEPLDGPFVTGLVATAAGTGTVVVAGMFEQAEPTRAYNTVVAVGPDGLLGRYRKMHLFDALGVVESERLVPGDGELLVVPVGDQVVGVLTCYDVRFPEIGRVLVDSGATCLAVPAAWYAGPHKVDIWSTLVRARAIENTVWVAAANQTRPYVGTSLVVDPYGLVVAALDHAEEGVAVADVTVERLQEVREQVPCLGHRRFSVVPGAPP